VGRGDEAYARLPVPLQHAAVTAFGARWYRLRFGPGYGDALRAFAARDRFDAGQWQRWQQRAVTAVASAAADRVPAYRDRWDRATRAAARRGQLGELPLLAKDDLRADPEMFLDPARRRLGAPLTFPTSGSSGTPLRTYWTVEELRVSMAVREVRSARWAGVSFRQPRATFSGRMVVTDPESAGPFHRWNAVERQAYFSAFHLHAETAEIYADALRRHHIVWGTGYAQSFARLGAALLDGGGPRPQLRAVVTTSEKLSDAHRATIAEAFSCVVREEYSSIENAFFASECEAGSLHVSPDVGVVEILREDGTVTDPGEVGEVVVTGLLGRLQPMIRYRVGDLAAWSDAPCSCSRAMPVLAEVAGRVEDVLTGPDGRRMTRVQGVFYEVPGLIEAQVIQRSSTRFEVRLVSTDPFGDGERALIVERMIERLGSRAEIELVEVDEIARTSAGKFRAVVVEWTP